MCATSARPAQGEGGHMFAKVGLIKISLLIRRGHHMSLIRGSVFVFGLAFGLMGIVATSVSIPSARAATLTWDNDNDAGDGNNTDFNNAFNWGAGQTGAVPGTSDNATFTGAAVIN